MAGCRQRRKVYVRLDLCQRITQLGELPPVNLVGKKIGLEGSTGGHGINKILLKGQVAKFFEVLFIVP